MRFVRPVSTGNRPLTLLTISITVESIWKILSMTVWLLCVLLQGWYWYRWIFVYLYIQFRIYVHIYSAFVSRPLFATNVIRTSFWTNTDSVRNYFVMTLSLSFLLLFKKSFRSFHIFMYYFAVYWILFDWSKCPLRKSCNLFSVRSVYQFLLYSSHSQPCSQKKDAKTCVLCVVCMVPSTHI